ncbi:hypothetical protein [Nitrobacter sp.]|uniref:hypothetical protein n=1 Tax=Nitrobacter sp. TaxID=29420 RepID=UPI00322066EC
MGLFLEFAGVPTPRLTGCGDHADHRLAAGMNVDVFDRDLLLTLAAMAVEGFEQRRVSARQLVGLGEVLAPPLEGLFADHGAPIAFHCSVVRGDQLRRHHAFQLVLGRDADQRGDRGAQLLVALLRA